MMTTMMMNDKKKSTERVNNGTKNDGMTKNGTAEQYNDGKPNDKKIDDNDDDVLPGSLVR
jgi:hypothetical protein